MTTPIPPQEYPEERRLATVLFADIQGFTALSEKLDFEVVSELIKDVWNILDQIILDHGGFIDKHIGDEVMAVWGAPQAGEDDAERAVTCALWMLAALEDYAETSTRTGARELRMRIGLNTGQVLATYVGLKNEYTVMGDTVNIANRLAEITEPGTILASEPTYRMVRGAFKVRQTEPVLLRGKSQAVNCFQVENKLEQPARVRYTDMGGLQTVMVGREDEMATLNEQYTLIKNAAVPAFVLVSGEVGLGKSRLLMEFTRKLDADSEPITIFSMRGVAEAEKAPFFAWRMLWKDRFGVTENMVEARERFLRGILQIWGNKLGSISAVEAAHVLGDMIGLVWEDSPYLRNDKSPEEKIERAFVLMQEVFYRIAQTTPILLLVDDMQWIDKRSLDLLDFLLRPGPNILPMLILGGARPNFIRSNISWANKGKIITLNRIPFTAELVKQAYPALNDFPVKMLETLAMRADGNPYFLEETVKSIANDPTETSTIDIDYDTLPPQNLQALLQARLDSLSREERDVLLLASVVGRTFWVGAVKAAARTPVGTGLLNLPEEVLDRIINTSLRQIIRVELAFPRTGSMFAGEQEYIFKHSLVRDVAYNMLPHKYLKFYHYAVAKWLAQRSGPDFNVMIAEHYEKAGNISAALRYYEQAIKYAQTRSASSEVKYISEKLSELKGTESAPLITKK